MKAKKYLTPADKNNSKDDLPHHDLSFMNDVKGSVWMIDRNYRLLYANHAFQDIFFSLLGKKLAVGECVFVPGASEKTNEQWKSIYDRVLQNGETFTSEIESILYPDKRFYEFTFSPVLSKNKSVEGIFVIGRDISEEKKNKEALTKSEQYIKSLFSAIPDLIFRIGDDGVLLDYKAAPEEFFALPDQFAGKHLSEIMPEWLTKLTLESIVKTIKSGKTTMYEFELPIPQKGNQHYESRLVPFTNREVIAIVRNITETKEHERKLRESESNARAIMESTNDFVILLDKNHAVIDSNEAHARRLNLTRKELIGKNIFDFLPGEAGLKRREQIEKVIKTRKPAHFEDFREGFWNEVLMNPVFNEKGKVEKIAVFARDITEKKQVLHLLEQQNKSLKESERMQSTMISNLPGFVYRCANDHNWTMIFISDACKVITGYSPDDFLNNSKIAFNDIVHPDYRQILWEEWQTILHAKNVFIYEYPIITAFDEIRWVYEQGRGVYSENGELLFLEGFIEDITDRKRAEAAQQESERRFRDIIEKVNMIGALINANAQITFVNDYLLRLTGWKREELIGKNWFEVFIPSDAKVRRDLFSSFEKGNVPVYYQNEILTRDGKHRLIDWSNTLLQDENGNPSGIAGLGVDITDRALAEEKLKHYKSIVAASSDMMAIIDKNYRFLAVNKTYSETFKLDPEQITSRTVPELVGNELFERVLKPEVDRCLKGENRNLQTWLTFPGFAPKYMDIHYYPYVNDKNEISGFVVNARDITQNKKAQEALVESENQLRELNLTKDRFFSIIAHDLKSPFNSLVGFSELLMEDAPNLDVKEIEYYAAVINNTANQTLLLLDNLLNWARMQQDRMEYVPKNHLLHEIADEVITLLAESYRQKSISLTNRIPENTIVRFDENMMKTTLRNLLSNAVKFTRSGGSVEITTKISDNEIIISVSDTGIGISRENIGKLFNIGSGFTTRGTRNEKGTGLGLLLCKEFVEKHGGRIWVDSEEAKGSVFSFSLPLK